MGALSRSRRRSAADGYDYFVLHNSISKLRELARFLPGWLYKFKLSSSIHFKFLKSDESRPLVVFAYEIKSSLSSQAFKSLRCSAETSYMSYFADIYVGSKGMIVSEKLAPFPPDGPNDGFLSFKAI